MVARSRHGLARLCIWLFWTSLASHTFPTYSIGTCRRYFSQPGYVWPSYYYNVRSRSSAPPDGFLSEPDTSDEEDYEY